MNRTLKSNKLIDSNILLLSSVGASVVFILINIKSLYQYLFSDNTELLMYTRQIIDQKIENITYAINNFSFTPSIMTLLIWAIIGAIVYVLIRFVGERFETIEKDVVESVSYVHPKEFKMGNFWFNEILNILLSLAISALLVIWAIISFRILIPFSTTTFYIALNDQTLSIIERLLMFIYSFGSTLLAALGFSVLLKAIHTRMY